MRPKDAKDSIFSSGKPQKIPWFFWLTILVVAGLVYLYLWFD